MAFRKSTMITTDGKTRWQKLNNDSMKKIFHYHTLIIDNPILIFVENAKYKQSNQFGEIQYTMTENLFKTGRFSLNPKDYFWIKNEKVLKNKRFKKLTVDEIFTPFSENAQEIL